MEVNDRCRADQEVKGQAFSVYEQLCGLSLGMEPRSWQLVRMVMESTTLLLSEVQLCEPGLSEHDALLNLRCYFCIFFPKWD